MEEDVHEEMKNIAPGFPVKPSIDAPAGYFDSFPNEVLNRWKEDESKPVVKRMTLKSIISIAAILTGLVIGGWWFVSKPSLVQNQDISALEAYQYINENIDDFEPLLETVDIDINENHLDITKEAVEEYLIEETHGTDPEDLF